MDTYNMQERTLYNSEEKQEIVEKPKLSVSV